MKVLKSIFDFYGKQTSLLGRNPTFDQINNNLQSLNLGEFLKFCADFQILKHDKNLSSTQLKQSYISAFKIVAENRKVINFDSFKQSLYILFKIDETPSHGEFHDKEMIEERICLGLRLDHPG